MWFSSTGISRPSVGPGGDTEATGTPVRGSVRRAALALLRTRIDWSFCCGAAPAMARVDKDSTAPQRSTRWSCQCGQTWDRAGRAAPLEGHSRRHGRRARSEYRGHGGAHPRARPPGDSESMERRSDASPNAAGGSARSQSTSPSVQSARAMETACTRSNRPSGQ